MRLVRAAADLKMTPLGLLLAAVTLMLAAAGTVVFGHIAATSVGPLLSIAFSAGAVACAVLALILPPRR
jgi:hypothetical protein